MLSKLLEKGNYDQEESSDHEKSQNKKYYTGVEFDKFFKQNKKTKQIKIFNKLFQNLDFDCQIPQEQQKKDGSGENDVNEQNPDDKEVVMFESMNLDLKPKESKVSSRGSFLKKAQLLKKTRGL